MSDDESNTAADGPQKVEELPEWAQSLIKDTRSEAASYRSKLRDAEKEAKKAAESELEEKYEKKINDLNSKLENAQKESEDASMNKKKIEAALEAGVPGDRAVAFADRLRGSDEKELKQDAEEALKVFSPQSDESNTQNSNRATDSTQGIGGDTQNGPRDANSAFGDFAMGQLK